MKIALLLLLTASIAAAQAPVENPAAGPGSAPPTVVSGRFDRSTPRDFGVGVTETYEIQATATTPFISDTQYGQTGPGRYITGGTGRWFIAPVTLPRAPS